MTDDDVLVVYRLRVLASARELGSVAAACRVHGIHRSTFYRWKTLAERFGSEILRPRERRRPQMPNSIPLRIEERIVAFALGHPGYGPAHTPASWPARSGAASPSRPTASGGCCAATACRPGPCASGCSPATPRHPSHGAPIPSPNATSP